MIFFLSWALMTSPRLIGFKVLNEPERTTALYTLLQHSTQDQLRFFVAILQQMIHLDHPQKSPGQYFCALTNLPLFNSHQQLESLRLGQSLGNRVSALPV